MDCCKECLLSVVSPKKVVCTICPEMHFRWGLLIFQAVKANISCGLYRQHTKSRLSFRAKYVENFLFDYFGEMTDGKQPLDSFWPLIKVMIFELFWSVQHLRRLKMLAHKNLNATLYIIWSHCVLHCACYALLQK